LVTARGHVPCDILIIGEAPGASEDIIGRPFVGPAGILLDDILEKSLDPDIRVAMTNLVCEATDHLGPEDPE
jgi:DNA polymerase